MDPLVQAPNVTRIRLASKPIPTSAPASRAFAALGFFFFFYKNRWREKKRKNRKKNWREEMCNSGFLIRRGGGGASGSVVSLMASRLVINDRLPSLSRKE